MGTKDSMGIWHEDFWLVMAIIKEHFFGVFSSSQPMSRDIEEVTNIIPSIVLVDTNLMLLRPFFHLEVKMHPNKSPSPDGSSPYFYQKH